MHLLTGHTLDKPLYLNAGLNKCAIHHILFMWQQVITICFQIERNISVARFLNDEELKYATGKWFTEQ